MKPWLKAGLIGGAVLVALNVLGLIPCVGLATCCIGILAYAGIGALAAYWLPPVRETGQAAGQGALAGLVAALIGGIVNMIIFTAQTALVDTASVLSQIPPEYLQQLQQAGMDPAMFTGPAAGVLYGGTCCGGGLVLAAILGAIGGSVFAAIRPDS
jgi:hypothetical protein